MDEIELVAEPMTPEREAEFLEAARASGMRDVTCACGRWFLTRGESDKCPPCRKAEPVSGEFMVSDDHRDNEWPDDEATEPGGSS